MSTPITVLGVTSLWPTTGDTGYSAQAEQLQKLLASAVNPIAGLYNSTTGHVGNLAINNADQLTINGTQVGGVLSFDGRTGAIILTSADVTTALGYTPGAGTVTSITGANGVSVATGTTTPVIGLGAITPSSVAASGTVTGSNLSGTNTGDQTTITGNAGSATVLQTARLINGVSFNGSADITVTAAAGTLSGSTLASGVTASSLTSVGALTALSVNNIIYTTGGLALQGTGSPIYASGGTGGTSGQVLTSAGPFATPTWTTPSGAAAYPAVASYLTTMFAY